MPRVAEGYQPDRRYLRLLMATDQTDVAKSYRRLDGCYQGLLMATNQTNDAKSYTGLPTRLMLLRVTRGYQPDWCY